MPRAAMIGLGLLWCGLVFAGTLYATFPSDELVARAKVEVPKYLGRDYSIDIERVSPWWVGLSARGVKVFKAERANPRSEEPPTVMPAAMAKKVRVRASPWSLVTRTPYVSGSVTLSEGRIDYAIGTAADDREQVSVSEVDVRSNGLPVSDLLALVPGFTGAADGNIDLVAAIEAGERGMSDANGRIDLSGGRVVLSDVELPEIGPLGMDVPIESLKVSGEIRDGKWTIDQGHVESELLTLEIEGHVVLRDPLDRSTMEIELTLSDLSEQFSSFEQFMSSAKGSDGAYHYECRGIVTRMQGCRARAQLEGVALPPVVAV